MGDGWLVSSVSPAEVATGIKSIRGYAAEAGRRVAEDHYGVLIPFYFAAEGGKACRAWRPFHSPAQRYADQRIHRLRHRRSRPRQSSSLHRRRREQIRHASLRTVGRLARTSGNLSAGSDRAAADGRLSHTSLCISCGRRQHRRACYLPATQSVQRFIGFFATRKSSTSVRTGTCAASAMNSAPSRRVRLATDVTVRSSQRIE